MFDVHVVCGLFVDDVLLFLFLRVQLLFIWFLFTCCPDLQFGVISKRVRCEPDVNSMCVQCEYNVSPRRVRCDQCEIDVSSVWALCEFAAISIGCNVGSEWEPPSPHPRTSLSPEGWLRSIGSYFIPFPWIHIAISASLVSAVVSFLL